MLDQRVIIEKCEIEGFPTDYKLYIINNEGREYFMGRYRNSAQAEHWGYWHYHANVNRYEKPNEPVDRTVIYR